MILQDAQQQLTDQLKRIYDAREAAAITDRVMEYVTGWRKIDRIVHKAADLSAEQQQQLRSFTTELLAHKPVQYVLHESWFAGMKFYVNEHVLIPRPETEELVEWIVKVVLDAGAAFTGRILDVGTGSGCIAIALKKKLPGATIIACDVSEQALAVARQNATDAHADIQFHQLNFPDSTHWSALPKFDIVVSNPPYVPLSDKATMLQNVVAHEPHLALFVEDDDPFLFYRAIADFAQTHLSTGGAVYVETHEELGKNVADLFAAKGFSSVELKKDVTGKDRMVRGSIFLPPYPPAR